MTTTALAAWVLSILTALEPTAPWKDTYLHTAEVFAKVAEDAPLFAGPDGARQTAAQFISVGWFEGTFKPDAKGDCKHRDAHDQCVSPPTSFCMFQISNTNFKFLDVTAEELLTDVEACTRAARRMMKQSFTNCRLRPQAEWLGWYAVGGPGCPASEKGKHRMWKAKWLFAHYPFTDES